MKDGKRMPFDNHVSVGSELKKLRLTLMRQRNSVQEFYPKKSKVISGYRKLLSDLDQLRSDLDSEMFDEYENVPKITPTPSIYYGD